MSVSTRFRSLLPLLLSAGVTAAVLMAALWVQHRRDGWPFASARPTSASAEPAAHDMAAMAPAETPDRVAVDSTAPGLQNLGIRLEEVKRESLKHVIQSVATIALDESRISHVHTRVAGWIEQLDVNTTGEYVRAGQPLARIFSQELLSSQTEYLAARRATAESRITSAVVEAGRTRLGVLGMTPSEIEAIERSGEPQRVVTVFAPRSGVVVNRGITVGTSVDPSTTLLTIADLTEVWVLAEVPEADISTLRVGSNAQLEFAASGRSVFAARIAFIYPTLTEQTRTLRVRFSVANPGGVLRPGLYGTATFETAGPPTMTVPRDAVVDTGRQQHVFVHVGDRYEPRAVTLGLQLADRVEILVGLSEGEHIVVAGVFLLDSESRLRATGGTGGHNHGKSPSEPAPAAKSDRAADPHAGHREPQP